MIKPRSQRPAPVWLSEHWEQKKMESVHRVQTAIECLMAEGKDVTISAIREKVMLVFGVRFSANTIKRNERAYTLYLSSRRQPRNRIGRDVQLRELYGRAGETQKPQLHAKAARLRRQSKDSLIARLIALEEAVKVQAEVENRLREEIIRSGIQTGGNQVRATEAPSSPIIEERKEKK